jgi:hypothetical protein
VAGGGVIGEFFHKGLKMTDEDVACIGREFGAGDAAAGVHTGDLETRAVADKLTELGGTPQAHGVATLAEGHCKKCRRTTNHNTRKRPPVRPEAPVSEAGGGKA